MAKIFSLSGYSFVKVFIIYTTILFSITLQFTISGTAANGFDSEVYWVYKVFLLFWLIVGLGYLAMILDYITAGMQSKKIANLEQFVKNNLKKTPIKVREELRSILNEFLLSRVKRVYKASVNENLTNLGKSKSCPNLSTYREKESPATTRRRALSACPCKEDLPELPRAQSDTDLTRIDKEKTFSPAEGLKSPNELLIRVANALGKPNYEESDEDDEEDGINCFSDSQILASENGWDMDGQTLTAVPPSKERQRAASEVKFPFHENADAHTLTWYGPAATKKLQEMRERMKYGRPRSRTLPAQPPPSQPLSFFTRLKNTLRGSSKDDKCKDIDVEGQDYVTYMPNTMESTREPPERHQQQRRGSIFPITDEAVLEETSIAEFIRALTAVRVPESVLNDCGSALAPRRKLATATTPPRYQTPPRMRRQPIRPNIRDRRCSLAPTSVHHEINRRRFSLRPVNMEGSLLAPTQEEGEHHLPPGGNASLPPPPYSAHEGAVYLRVPVTRRYSINPAGSSSSPGATQRQVMSKKDKEKDEKDK